MAYKKRGERKRSYGGKAETGNQYNAQGSPEEKSEKAKSDGFKKGGMVEGEKSRHHLAKRARGGAMMGHNNSRSPMSSAHSVSGPGNKRGSPGEQAPVRAIGVTDPRGPLSNRIEMRTLARGGAT